MKTSVEAEFSNSAENSIRNVLKEKNTMINSAITLFEDSVSKGLVKNDKEYIKTRIEKIKKNPKAVVVLIKSEDGAKYNSLVKAMDAIMSANIGRYAMVDLSEGEKEYLKKDR